MAANSASVQLAERSDIHKSCKSLETLLNILNDYCEAAGAVVVLQKKLAKALRETAGLRVTGEIAAHAMSASATIFEAGSDIDSKFAKIADKEYDGISIEVKKWFKKLAKEEKLHDDKMANANARIKQAGQVFEKKSKKGARDATEEHARYINLISSLGPEISQEKYNHALNVTQRHTSTIYSTAACLSRIADAGWLRAYEGVRRFSPTIGQLGEWRALCEGGWVGSLPQDLPDLDEGQRPQPNREVAAEGYPEDNTNEAPTTLRNVDPQEMSQSNEHALPQRVYPSSNEAEKPRDFPPTHSPPTMHPAQSHQYNPTSNQGVSVSTGPSSFEPPRPFIDPNTGSVRSLSAFPSPPTHFPIPPPRQQQSSQSQSSQASSSQVNLPALGRLTESPLPDDNEDDEDVPTSLQPQQEPPLPSVPAPQPPEHSFEKTSVTEAPNVVHNQLGQDAARPTIFEPSYPPAKVPTSNQHPNETPSITTLPDSHPRFPDNGGDQRNKEREPGVDHTPKGRAPGVMKSQGVERSNTSDSSESIVAAMRNRYSNISKPASPTLKDVPRLPLSVNDLATRYQPMDGPSSPRTRTPSASMSRQLPPSPGDPQYQDRRSSEDHQLPPSPSKYGVNPKNEPAYRRHQRMDDLAALELKEKELELQERERDLQMRTRELEKDRARLIGAREGDKHGSSGNGAQNLNNTSPLQIRPRERRTSFRKQRPQSQFDSPPTSSPMSSNALRPQSQYSYSTSHLVPPSPNSARPSHSSDSKTSNHSQSQYSSSSQSPSSQYREDQPHAPYCGCESCSVSKYKVTQVSPQPLDLRPPAQPITLRPAEKSKPGWIRRLSMPVGNAFSLDSSKHSKGIANIASTPGNHGRSGIFSLDGRKNISTTTLMTGIQEDGRRSYDAAAISNQSMTNLVGGGRR